MLLAIPLLLAGAENPDLTPQAAGRIFREAQAIVRAEGGRLWGKSLAGPMLLVDPRTRRAIASEADAMGLLRAEEGVFVGTLPEGVGGANSAITWGGKSWTTWAWPLVEAGDGRRALLAHELFHRIQPGLAHGGADLPCPHLDTLEGRVWLRMELRALRAALGSAGRARRAAIADALAFRARRQALAGPEAARAEAALERHEGLAEYTGAQAGLAPDRAREYARAKLAAVEGSPSFSRSFPYATGPAYGLLLDAIRPGWRRAMGPDADLSRLLALPAGDPETALPRLGGAPVRAEEEARDRARQTHLADLKRRFQEGPLLRLSMQGVNYRFNPSRQETFEGLGIHHPSFHATGPWGTLKAEGGALLLADWSAFLVPAPEDPTARPLHGPGWTLELNPGWAPAPGPRPGDFTLQAAQP